MRRFISFLVLTLTFTTLPLKAAERVFPVHTAVNVTTSSASVLSAATAGRRSLLILINDSDTTIYCNIAGAAAVLSQGIRLNASGGAIVLDVSVPSGAVFCLHGGSGNKVLLITTG